MRLPKHVKLFVVPLLRRDVPPRAVGELDVILRSEEVGNAVPVLVLQPPRGNDLVDGRAEAVAREEAQSIADVDDGVARLRGDESPAGGLFGQHLESPLLAEEEGQGADVGVLVVADAEGEGVLLGVAEHGERCEGFFAWSVKVDQLGGLVGVETNVQVAEDAHAYVLRGVGEAQEEVVVFLDGGREGAILS